MTAPIQTDAALATASGTSLGVAQTSAPTVGDLNVVFVVGNPFTGQVITVADSQGHTYTARGSLKEAAIDAGIFIFTAPITSSGANTVTATYGTSAFNRGIVVAQMRGTYDVSNTGTDTGTNPTATVSATNTAQPATVVMGIVDLQSGSPGVGTGYTDSGAGLFWATGYPGRVQYKEVTTVASQSGNFTNPSFSRNVTAMVIVVDAAGAPTINTQPTDQTVYEGNAASFSVSATSSGGALSYQWKDDGSNVGTNSNTYAPTPVLADNLSVIRCDVSDSNGTTSTNNVILRVIATARVGWLRA